MERREILESWKEIAAYLKRNVRTCQAWEKERGLPIHRMEDSPKARVFAYPDEIDQWLGEKLRGKETPGTIARSHPGRLFIAALALIMVAGGILLMKGPRRNNPADTSIRKSIAVLPFVDLSPDQDQAAWCEGIAETLLNSLANAKNLQVRGRQSSFRFTARDNPMDVGRKLKADMLLIGSIQKSGDRLRITAQLINASDGTLAWSDKYDGAVGEIFDIQDRIVSAALRKMHVELGPGERARLLFRNTSDQQAYDLYLKANFIVNSGLEQDMERAVPLYLEATRKDPAFALAHIALARCYKELAFGYEIRPKEEGYRLSKEALDRAFVLDRENGEAFAVRAALKLYHDNDTEGAERDYQRALQLSAGSSIIRRDYIQHLIITGRVTQALSEANRLNDADPLDLYGYYALGLAFYCLRRYDDSISAHQDALELDPYFVPAQCGLVYTLHARGQYEKVRDILERFKEPMGDNYLWLLAATEGAIGNEGEAESLRQAMHESMWEKFKLPVPAIYDAAIYAALGNRDRTLENLNKSLDENPGRPLHFLYWHFFDDYRSDPEFVLFFKKAGFEMR